MSDKISKYFLPKPSSSSSFNTANESLDDFATPKRINTKSNIKAIKKAKEKKNKKVVQKNQTRLTKIATQSSALEVNPEHWQLAIALSRSLQKPEEKEENLKEDGFSLHPSTQEKIASLKENLQQFGFKSGTGLEVQNRRPPPTKKKKKSRFQCVTPVLMIRKQTDREQMIAEKISLILSDNLENKLRFEPLEPHEPFSQTLQKFWNRDNKIYNIHRLELHLLSQSIFYVEELNLEVDNTKCGCLLKNWGDIPGRDRSPVRDLCFDDLPFTQTQVRLTSSSSRILSPKRSVTPELFDSEDEVFVGDSPKLLNSTAFQNDNYNEANLKFSSQKKSDLFGVLSPQVGDQFASIDSGTCKNLNSSQISISSSSQNSYKTDLESVPDEEEKELECKSQSFFTLNNQPDDAISFNNEDLKHFNGSDGQKSPLPCLLEKETNFLLKQDLNCHSMVSEEANSPTSSVPDDTIILDNSYSELLAQTNSFKSLPHMSPKDVMIENDNGICVIEGFSKDENEIPNCIDLTLSSDEEEMKPPVSSTSFIFESPISRSPRKRISLRKSLSFSFDKKSPDKVNTSYLPKEKFLLRKSQSFSFDKTSSDKILKNSSLNITDYINNVLDNSLEEEKRRNSLSGKRTLSASSSSASLGSQKSYCISDEELNYSCKFGNYDFSDNEEEEEDLISLLPRKQEDVFATPCEVLKHPRLMDLTQTRKSLFESEVIGTPTNDVMIKTENVTPIVNYEEFSTPTIHEELNKFGLKPMKRQRGIQILKHLYESTHPVADLASEPESNKEEAQIIKRRKYKSSLLQIEMPNEQNIEIVGNLISECDPNVIFEKKRSSKILSCQLPLHIAWHNLVTSQPSLKQNILLYEPIQLEEVYDMLKEQGHAYHIQDIMTFLDRHCINIKIEQSSGRGHHRRKKDKPSKKT